MPLGARQDNGLEAVKRADLVIISPSGEQFMVIVAVTYVPLQDHAHERVLHIEKVKGQQYQATWPQMRNNSQSLCIEFFVASEHLACR